MTAGTCPDCGHSQRNGNPLSAPEDATPHNGHQMSHGKVPPELREWAIRNFNLEEFMAGVREIQETGGVELKDFIHELEQEAAPRE
jgi:hypothetical protein